MNEYQKDVSRFLSNPFRKIWFWIGVKRGYLDEFWSIRLKHYLKLDTIFNKNKK